MLIQNWKASVLISNKVLTKNDKSHKVMAVDKEGLKLTSLMQLSF